MKNYCLTSLQDTKQLAHQLSQKLHPGSVVAFVGNLGAGKTTFIKYLAQSLCVKDYVNSPTFTIINVYEAEPVNINHIDFYRLQHREELVEIGLEEYLNPREITVIEWADKFPELLPDHTIWVTMTTDSSNRRVSIKE